MRHRLACPAFMLHPVRCGDHPAQHPQQPPALPPAGPATHGTVRDQAAEEAAAAGATARAAGTPAALAVAVSRAAPSAVRPLAPPRPRRLLLCPPPPPPPHPPRKSRRALPLRTALPRAASSSCSSAITSVPPLRFAQSSAVRDFLSLAWSDAPARSSRSTTRVLHVGGDHERGGAVHACRASPTIAAVPHPSECPFWLAMYSAVALVGGERSAGARVEQGYDDRGGPPARRCRAAEAVLAGSTLAKAARAAASPRSRAR